MLVLRFLLPCFLLLSLLLTPLTAAAATPRVYWGAYIDQVPWDSAKLAAFEQTTGKGQSIISMGNAWAHAGQFQSFPLTAANMIRTHGSIPMIGWASFDDTRQDEVQSDYQLAAITNGAYDPYLYTWAIAARAWGHPFFLRVDWEMNGYWRFPWAESVNGNQPGDYVRAWRHIHDIFTRVGVTNASWVWNPNYSAPSMTPLAELYPGDGYVDWTALDGYNWGTDAGNSWQSFAQIFGGIAPATYGGENSYRELLTIAPGKPIMIAETGTSIHGGYASAWVTDVLQRQIPLNFIAIKAVVWMQSDWAIDSRLDVTSAEATAFRNGIASPVYASNQFAYLPSGKVPLP